MDIILQSGFGGLGVVCWPLVPKFSSSNPDEAEAVGYLRAKKPSARFPSFAARISPFVADVEALDGDSWNV